MGLIPFREGFSRPESAQTISDNQVILRHLDSKMTYQSPPWVLSHFINQGLKARGSFRFAGLLHKLSNF